MKSIGQMIELIEGMADTHDLTDWENKFVKHVGYLYHYDYSKDTSKFSNSQVDHIEEIYTKHFAGLS